MIKKFLIKNKVFITGLIAAISLSSQQFLTENIKLDYKVFAFAIFIAILSYLANEWSGKGLTLIGIIGTVAGIFVQLNSSGKINWWQFIIVSLIAIITAALKEPVPSVTSEKGLSATNPQKGISAWVANALK